MNKESNKIHRINVSWIKFYRISCFLLSKIKKEHVRVDVIVGNVRGGLPLAVFLAHHLGIGTENFGTLRVRRHINDDVDAKIIKSRLTGVMIPGVVGKNVLLVEDTISTGASSLRVMVGCLERRGAKSVTAVAMFIREIEDPPVKILYYHKNTDLNKRQWVTFPWEK